MNYPVEIAKARGAIRTLENNVFDRKDKRPLDVQERRAYKGALRAFRRKLNELETIHRRISQETLEL